MNIEYRPMTIQDYPTIKDIWMEADNISFSESDTNFHINKYLEQNPNCSFVAVDGNKIIGTVLAGEDARRGFINHLYVLPEYRNHGIGNTLLYHAEQSLAQKHPTKAYVFVTANNFKGIEYWKKNYYCLCEDFVTMRKSLSSEPFDVYEELTEQSVISYLTQKNITTDCISANEFGDGNMNYIFKVCCKNDSFILKQAMPHGKIDVTVFEPMDRANYENNYIEYFSKFMGNNLQKHLGFDPIMNVNLYEDLSSMKVLRFCLLNGNVREGIGKEIGEYLAQQYYYSSSYYLGIEKKKSLENTFSNYRMRQLTEDFILVNPFEDSPNNNIDSVIRPLVEQLWKNHRLCSKAKVLATKFVSNKECILSGDFHPGNIFVSDEKCIFFDFDFAMWGPIAYDLGTMLGNLIISLRTRKEYQPLCNDFDKDIVSIITEMFTAFHENVRLYLKEMDSDVVSDILDTIDSDAFGYAAATIGGRTYGYARFKEITMLENSTNRKNIIKSLLGDMEYLMLDCKNLDSLVSYLCA